MEPVLVTGAAGGRQGSTGHLVARQLERGQPVRAFTHSDDARAARFRDLGAEVRVGDLREISSVLPALGGVRRAFFTYPVTSGMLDAVSVFAAAAHREGLRRVVDVSQLAADPAAGTPHMRRHWVAEQVLDTAGIGAVHLRAAVFFENLAVLADAADGRELALPLGSPDTELPLVAMGVLTAADEGIDPVVLLTGEVLRIAEAAEAFGLRYTDIDPDAWRSRAPANLARVHPGTSPLTWTRTYAGDRWTGACSAVSSRLPWPRQPRRRSRRARRTPSRGPLSHSSR